MVLHNTAAEKPVTFQIEQDRIKINQPNCCLFVSLKRPRFIFKGGTASPESDPVSIEGDLLSDKPVKLKFESILLDTAAHMEVELFVQWFPAEDVLRKWASFIVDRDCSVKVLEVVLEQFDGVEIKRFDGVEIKRFDGVGINPSDGMNSNAGELNHKPQQSQPAFLNGFFVGMEYPTASTRLEAGKLLLAHKPGLELLPGICYETRKAVYGTAAEGQEKIAFQRYLRSHFTNPGGLHINYNSWWTSPVPYTENDILQLMRLFKEQLYDPHGTSFDTFCIDLGWSNPQSIWEIDTVQFPDGFTRIEQAASEMNCDLGVWISPSSCYSQALDNEWAEEQGVETTVIPWVDDHKLRIACLGGKHYRESFKSAILKLVKEYKIRHFKFDGCILECMEEHHGHEPGVFSSEAIAEGIIAVFKELHEAVPEIWLETTCFGWNPSPWWLFYVDSVIGSFGDDSPYGRVPAPVYRESYTSARDYFNLQGAKLSPIPIAAQEVLGIAHQTGEPFMNDAVMTVMRGHTFLPVYLNPEFMTDSRWKAFAEVLQWARSNASILEQTEALLPISWVNGSSPAFSNKGTMPREPYGYAHWKDSEGLVVIRNPWITPCSYRLHLPESSTLAPEGRGLQAVSIYPEIRIYGENIRAGDILDIPLAPYETIVLSISHDEPVGYMDYAKDILKPYIRADIAEQHISQTGLHMDATVEVLSPQAEILILIEAREAREAREAIPQLAYQIKINGMEAHVTCTGSETGWAMSSIPMFENHWRFLRSPIPDGKNSIHIEMSGDFSAAYLSVWVWATKPGGEKSAVYPNALPEPETISLDAYALVKPVLVNEGLQ